MPEFCAVAREGHLCIVTMNRPEVMNALHPPANFELEAVFDDFAADPEMWVAIITGAGDRAFSAGNDLKYTAAHHGRLEINPKGFAGLTARYDNPKPVIAAVNGVAMGGGFEIALACDLIFAAENAVFGLPEVALGVFPPAAAALLPLRIGYARATELILTGRAASAQELAAAGLVHMIAPDADLSRCVDEWFDQHFSTKSAAALRHAAGAARFALAAHVSTVLPALEQIYLDDLMRTHDAVEGIQAFLEKRPPAWDDQ